MTSLPDSALARPVFLVAVGSAVGRRTVTNDELARTTKIPAASILALTGVQRRSYAPFEETEDLAFRATQHLFSRLSPDTGSPGMLLFATTTPSSHIPATAMHLHRRLYPAGGGPPALDIGGSCAAFMTGLVAARSLVGSGAVDSLLLVNAEKKTRHLCPVHAPETALLFGDGASAAWICARPPAGRTVLRLTRLRIGADGSAADLVTYGFDPESGRKILHMEGGGLFRKAVRTLSREIGRLMEEEGLSPEETGALVLHQANRRIVSGISERLGFPREKVPLTLCDHGNTSSASLGITLGDFFGEEGRRLPRAPLLLGAAGGGITWGVGRLDPVET